MCTQFDPVVVFVVCVKIKFRDIDESTWPQNSADLLEKKTVISNLNMGIL